MELCVHAILNLQPFTTGILAHEEQYAVKMYTQETEGVLEGRGGIVLGALGKSVLARRMSHA